MHWRGAETHEEGTQRKIKLYQFQHYLTGQNHFVEADPSVRKVKEVEVGNHKILTYRLHLWSQLLVAVVLLHCNCQILFGGVFFLELSFSDVLGFFVPSAMMHIPGHNYPVPLNSISLISSIADAENKSTVAYTLCETDTLCEHKCRWLIVVQILISPKKEHWIKRATTALLSSRIF